jgi:hypothetical protein
MYGLVHLHSQQSHTVAVFGVVCVQAASLEQQEAAQMTAVQGQRMGLGPLEMTCTQMRTTH